MSAKFVNGKIVEFNNPVSPMGLINKFTEKYNGTGSFTIDESGFYSLFVTADNATNIDIRINNHQIVYDRITYAWNGSVNCQLFLTKGDVVTYTYDSGVSANMHVLLLSTNI